MVTELQAAICQLGDPVCTDPGTTGSKTAHISFLAASFAVPSGFCVTGPVCEDQVSDAYWKLAGATGDPEPVVAVRSSALEEDGTVASFAGQHETVLNVSGVDAVLEAIALCRASAISDRAQEYRKRNGFQSFVTAMPVLVQQFIVADASAVAFSVNPVNGDSEILINASPGIGEAVVSGAVTPDTYIVRRPDLKIDASEISDKRRMTVAVPGGTEVVDIPHFLRRQPALNDEQILELARLVVTLEERMGWPVDIEAAWSGGDLYLLQCRPVTTNGAKH